MTNNFLISSNRQVPKHSLLCFYWSLLHCIIVYCVTQQTFEGDTVHTQRAEWTMLIGGVGWCGALRLVH